MAKLTAVLVDGDSPTLHVAEKLLALCKVNTRTGCWVWQGRLTEYLSGQKGTSGYGQVRYRREDGTWTNRRAHVVAYEVWVGPIPEKYQVDHLCHRRSCINPSHLEAVTQAENRHRQMLHMRALRSRLKIARPAVA